VTRRLAFPLLAAALALSGCGGDAPPDYNPSINPEARAQAEQQHPQLLAEFGGAFDGPEAKYVKQLGETLAGAAGLADQCTFTMVNTDVVNAFAVPGCYIYITRGLFGIVNSEAELASVLGHEIGHIVAAHSERRQKRSIWSGLGALAVGVLTGSETLANMAGRAAQFYTLSYSRKQEFESDDLGIRYLAQAGYDPYAAADMLESLGDHDAYQAQTRGLDEAQAIPQWARSHPLTNERIKRAERQAEATGHGPDVLPEHEDRFLKQVDGLLWGDDPEQGFVIGRRFAHPSMGIQFEAPEGFFLANSPRAVLIDGGEVRGQFGGAELPSRGIQAYAEMVLAEALGKAAASARAGPVERTRVNGLEAIIVPTTVQTKKGQVQITVAAVRGRGREGFHFLTAGAPGAADAALRSLIGSFRLLNPAEVAVLRPRRIRVVTVGQGDTIQSMARRMAVPDHHVEAFLMLNDRDPKPQLRPGEKVKLIVQA
jgi:predicted Zn-dependent protease